MLLTCKEVAEMCNLSERTVAKNRMRIKGGFKIGRLWRYPRDIIVDCIVRGEDIYF